MKISKPLFFLLVLVIAGCQANITKTAKQDGSNIIRGEEKKTVTHLAETGSCDTTIVNNELSLDVLAFRVFKEDTVKIKSLFRGGVALKLKKQGNSEGGSYYWYDFTDGINKLTLYNNDGFYLQEGIIKDGGVLLNKKLLIGMDKDEFLKLVDKANINCDTVSVVNDESTFEVVYIFSDSKLKQIKMGQILE